jgi:alpha-galactosidase
MQLRAWTVAQRQMGFEMDPRELDEDEAAYLRRVTEWWIANRDWTMGADIHRLPSDAALIAEQQMAPGGGRFVVFAAQVATTADIVAAPLRLTGLEAGATYRLDLVTRDDLPDLSRGVPALKAGAMELPGAWLVSEGVALPWSFPQHMRVIEGVKV